MKRVALFLLTNLAILLVVSCCVTLLGTNSWLSAHGLNYSKLLVYCALYGFTGSLVSLMLSKVIARWTSGAWVIDGSEGPTEAWLIQTVANLAHKAGISMPEVAIYEGDPNAFATGPSRNSALVAVSTGLLGRMNRSQVEAVLAHEVAHISNGDMVTMSLIQGVVNTFVMFAARVVSYAIDRVVLKHEGERPGMAYSICVLVLDMVFGLLASLIVAYFSRSREYRADAGAAELMGTPVPMISALGALGGIADNLPKNMAALGIAGGGLMGLFATHPAIEDRITALSG